jgi:hypothetical protein
MCDVVRKFQLQGIDRILIVDGESTTMAGRSACVGEIGSGEKRCSARAPSPLHARPGFLHSAACSTSTAATGARARRSCGLTGEVVAVKKGHLSSYTLTCGPTNSI